MAEKNKGWKDFQQKISNKRSGGSKGDGQKKLSSIMVQRMAPIATGKQKKYEPERTRDFVHFTEYSNLTLANVKKACERFYNEPQGSCDVLFSDRGPSCIEDEQIAGKKVILIRFIQATGSIITPTPTESSSIIMDSKIPGSVTISKSLGSTTKRKRILSHSCISTSTKRMNVGTSATPREMARSVSIADVLKAGKLCQPQKESSSKFILEYFDIKNKIWIKKKKRHLTFTQLCFQKVHLERHTRPTPS